MRWRGWSRLVTGSWQSTAVNKPTRLDEREWDLMRTHTLVGERILRTTPALAGVATLVRSSHERFDGTGYPDRLAGEEIPLGARIVAACDAFTAMTSDRPYALARAVEEAVRELRRGGGTQFDQTVVDVVCAVIEERRDARRQPVLHV